MQKNSFIEYLEHHSEHADVPYWLRDLGPADADHKTWSFAEGTSEIKAVAAWIEDKFGEAGTSMAILSRNRAHWILSDIAIMTSGNVTIPLFQTMSPDMIQYICDFTDTQVLFVGEAANWPAVKHLFEDRTIVAMPGFDPGMEHIKWEDILADYAGKAPSHAQDPEALCSIVFSSGTTGVPKGIMQSQNSLLKPGGLLKQAIGAEVFFSYLPLSHIAERVLVETASVVSGVQVSFNQGMETMMADLQATRPDFLFGPPRIWETIQQGLVAKFGGTLEAFDAVLEQGGEAMKAQIRAGLGLDRCKFCLAAAAPTAPSLIMWLRDKIGLPVAEGFGQTEIMSAIVNMPDDFRLGSIGKPILGVDARITEEGELCVRGEGMSLGYYKRPEATAETFQDGWVHTGDKARVDEDGFYYITGRVKDTFKTIQGKFVSPNPIEKQFGDIQDFVQLCLIGRGLSKPVMVGVLGDVASDKAVLEAAIQAKVAEINEGAEHHCRIGAVIIANEPWTIENRVLTHTMKIKREEVDKLYLEMARDLALKSAQDKCVLIHWA